MNQKFRLHISRRSSPRCSEKFRKIYRKTPVPESLFNKVAGLRHRCRHRCFTCEFCEISKNTFFHKEPLVASSIFGAWNKTSHISLWRSFSLKYYSQWQHRYISFFFVEVYTIAVIISSNFFCLFDLHSRD